MSRRYYVETSPEGQPQFVKIKRSRSYNYPNRNHHRQDDRDYFKVSVEEWNRMVERERELAEQNKTLSQEVKTLKRNLEVVGQDDKQLREVTIPRLQSQISALWEDNEGLRRSLEHGGDHSSRRHSDVQRLQKKVDRLEGENKAYRDENDDLRTRIRELRRQLDGSCNRRIDELMAEVRRWKDQCRKWKTAYDELYEHRNALDRLLETRAEKIRVYEEMLKRNGIL